MMAPEQRVGEQVDVRADVSTPEPQIPMPTRPAHGSGTDGAATITRATAAA